MSDPDILATADKAVEAFYWHLYGQHIGSRFHAFIEWCGVLSEYLKMVKDSGVEPCALNTHSRVGCAVPEHQLLYMAEKLNCILAPFLNSASEKNKQLFVKILLGGK
jgi:hypothetical protein